MLSVVFFFFLNDQAPCNCIENYLLLLFLPWSRLWLVGSWKGRQRPGPGNHFLFLFFLVWTVHYP